MEYGVYDAVRAGFDKVVFIIKPDMRELMERLCGNMASRLHTADGRPVEVRYAYQDDTTLPAWYTKPAGADKALRHGPRGAVYPRYRTRALLRHQRRRFLRRGRLPHHICGAAAPAGDGCCRHGGLSAEEHRHCPRHRVPGCVPCEGRVSQRHPRDAEDRPAAGRHHPGRGYRSGAGRPTRWCP